MQRHQIIVIGSSAGGIEALVLLVKALPRTFAASICITQHLSPTRESLLPAILTRSGSLPVLSARDGMTLQAGTIFLAPPGHNMTIREEGVVLTHVPLQRPSPSIDRLFISAALSYGPCVIGVVLTGLRTDGTVGMQRIKGLGGTTIIQDPLSARYSSMPRSVQVSCLVDYCLPLEQIAPLLHTLTS